MHMDYLEHNNTIMNFIPTKAQSKERNKDKEV